MGALIRAMPCTPWPSRRAPAEDAGGGTTGEDAPSATAAATEAQELPMGPAAAKGATGRSRGRAPS